MKMITNGIMGFKCILANQKECLMYGLGKEALFFNGTK